MAHLSLSPPSYTIPLAQSLQFKPHEHVLIDIQVMCTNTVCHSDYGHLDWISRVMICLLEIISCGKYNLNHSYLVLELINSSKSARARFLPDIINNP